MEMERRMRVRHRVIPAVGLVLVTAVLAWAGYAWADFKAGMEAFDRQDYEAALKEFRPLAQEADATAQYNLGVMYRKGHGVPQDYKEAARWLLSHNAHD